MVKNAVKIIIVNILQLNDSTVNKLITDVPFVNLFTHIACSLRDKIIEIDSLHNPQSKQTFEQEKDPSAAIDIEKLEDQCDDLSDLM